MDVGADGSVGLRGGEGALEDGAVDRGGDTIGGGDGFRSDDGLEMVSSIEAGILSRNPGERGEVVSVCGSVGVWGSSTDSSGSFARCDSSGSACSSKLWNPEPVDTPPKPGESGVGVALRTSANAEDSSGRPDAELCAKLDHGSGESERLANGSANGFCSSAAREGANKSSKPSIARYLQCPVLLYNTPQLVR